ncbi:MAG: hypothetical protein K1X64_23290 [Myxococcaceae bacterium]|nr:hypothetical protein [Myxococcaceae bacterium]
MGPQRRLFDQRTLWLLTALFAACGGSSFSCGGCGGGCLTPLPNGYQGGRVENAVNVRVSQDGFNFVNTNWPTLLPSLGLNNPIPVPIPCTGVGFGSGGIMCDQNGNGSCDPGEHCNASVNIAQFSLQPNTPAAADTAVIQGIARLQINTGKMWMNTCAAKLFGSCICRLKCAADFSSGRSGNPTDDLTVDLTFNLDPKWGKILSFNVASINGIQNIDSGDLQVDSSGVCSLTCQVINIGFVKSFLVDQFVIPLLQQEVNKAVNKARCRPCGAGCPMQSSCQNGVCTDSSGACVPLLVGMEGQVNFSSVTGSMGGSGQMDMLIAAGGQVSSAAGSHFQLGVLGGAQPAPVSTCVPAAKSPILLPIPAPDLTAAPPGYHVGISISEQFLNRFSWGAHQGGALCLNLAPPAVSFLTTATFKPFLTSLAKVAGSDESPMMMVVRPYKPPVFTFGRGTVDPMTQALIDPLMTVSLNDLAIDFYAQIDERQVRLFTVLADVSLPMALNPEGCDKLVPVLGDLTKLVTVKDILNSDILAEDVTVLKGLLPSAISLVAPQLAGGLSGFTLPEVGGFRVKVSQISGITPIPATPYFSHIGIFAQFIPSGQCAVAAPQATAQLKQLVMPSKEALFGRDGPTEWPTAVLAVSAVGAPGSVEYAYRIDNGLWSTFRRANHAGELAVRDPLLLLQGTHNVEIRARGADDIHGVSQPVSVGVVIDLEAPTVTVHADREHGVIDVKAFDSVSAASALTFAYRVGDEAFSRFGPARVISLESVENQGTLQVQVKDEAGWVGQAEYRVAKVADRGTAFSTASAETASNGGCSSVDGLGWGLLGLLGLAARRRVSRAARA